MDQDLNGLSPAQLGRLFPISLCAYDPGWPAMFRTEKQALLRAAGSAVTPRIHHIGSTAVTHLAAKPVIDILMAVPKTADLNELKQMMRSAGYSYAPQPRNPAPHMMFMKGYSPAGYVGQAYHVHLRYFGPQDEIIFRDYLRAHPEDAQRYARLKERLAGEYRYDRDGYTEAKTGFIRQVLAKAKQAPRRMP